MLAAARNLRAIAGLGALLWAGAARAQDAAPATDTGDTAWMLTSTALVLFMTIPGLSLFYGGLVRTRNVLSVLMQCFVLTCLVTLLWLFYGYSAAFSTSGMQAGATTLAVDAGETLLVDKTELLAGADAAGIAIWGMERG